MKIFLQVACELKIASEMEIPCCVRGYHMYKEVLKAVIGEALEFHWEPTNTTDRYAVAVMKAATIIRHLPRKLSKVCSLFYEEEARYVLQ